MNAYLQTEENEGDFKQVQIISQTIPTEQNEAQSSFGFVSDRTFKTLTNDGQSEQNQKQPSSQRQTNQDRLHAPMIIAKSQQSNQSDDRINSQKESNEEESMSKRMLLSKMDEFTKDLASSKKSRKGSQQSTPGSNYGRNSANSKRKQQAPVQKEQVIEKNKAIEEQKEGQCSSSILIKEKQLQQENQNSNHQLMPATSTPVIEFQNASFRDTLRLQEEKQDELLKNRNNLDNSEIDLEHFSPNTRPNNQNEILLDHQEQYNSILSVAQTGGFPQSLLDEEDLKDLTLTGTQEGTGLMKRAIQLQAVLQSLQSPSMSGQATPMQNNLNQQQHKDIHQQTQEFCDTNQGPLEINNFQKMKEDCDSQEEFQQNNEQPQYHYNQINEAFPQLIARNRVMDLKQQLAEIRRSQQQQEQFAKEFAQEVLMEDSSSLSQSEEQQYEHENLPEYPIQDQQQDSLEFNRDDGMQPYEDQYSGQNAANNIYQQLHYENPSTVHYMSAHPQLQRVTQNVNTADYQAKQGYKYRPEQQPTQSSALNNMPQDRYHPKQENKYQYQTNDARTNQHVNERFKNLKLNNNSSQQSFNQFATGATSQMSSKFNLLKNVIEQSFAQQRAASLTSKSIQPPQQSFQEFNSISTTNQHQTAQSPSLNCQSRASNILQPIYSSGITNNHYQSQTSSVSNGKTLKNGGNCSPNHSLETENAMLKQQIKVLTQNEKILLKQIEKQQRKVGKERERWEDQMKKMQNEVSQLNDIITKMMSEKNRKQSMKCECRP